MENDKINVLDILLEKHFPVKNVLEFMKFVLEKLLFGPTLLGPMNPCSSVRQSVRLNKVMILPTISFF